METKVCKICGLEKEIIDFYFRKENNNYRTECKKCMLEKQKSKRVPKMKIKKERITPSSKKCSKCKIDKLISDYRTFKNSYIATVCRECENQENKNRYIKRKMQDPSYVENKKVERENEIIFKRGLKK